MKRPNALPHSKGFSKGFGIGLIMSLALLLASCGSGGGGTVETTPVIDSTPVISNLQFSPATLLQNDGGGTKTVSGTLAFTDLGGDLATLNLTTADGRQVSTPIDGVAGIKSGTIAAMVVVDTTLIGTFNFQVSVTDSGGRVSNVLTGTFAVKPNDTASQWTQQSLGPLVGLYRQSRVRWSGSLFVTVGIYEAGKGTIFTSPDAVTWTERPAGIPPPLYDVTWTGSQFVAVGGVGTILTSPTGSVWTTRAIPYVASPTLHGVVASGTRIVAVGSQIPGLVSEVLIMTSTDGGATWTVVPITFPGALYSVVWSGSQFVAVGGPMAQAIALTSPDGITWTNSSIALLGLSTLYDIAWNGSSFVTVGAAGAAISSDGTTWQASGMSKGTPIYSSGWSGQRFLACGLSSYCQTSTDGLQWQLSAPLPVTGFSSVQGLVWNGIKWVVVGEYAYVATSP